MINAERLSPSSAISNFSGRKNDGSTKENYAFSPTQLGLAGKSSGYYWFKSPSMTDPYQLYFYSGLISGRYFVRVFNSAYGSMTSESYLNLNIDWDGIMVQRPNGQFQTVEFFSTYQLYNTRNSLATGNNGRRVFLGYAGGHGIYSSAQEVCNWGTASGAVGAGWDGGTCGSYPDNLIWGTGNGSNAVYDNRSNSWQHWITW